MGKRGIGCMRSEKYFWQDKTDLKLNKICPCDLSLLLLVKDLTYSHLRGRNQVHIQEILYFYCTTCGSASYGN